MGKHCKWGTCNSDYRKQENINFIPFTKPCKDHRLLKRDSSLLLTHNSNSCAQCSKCLLWINACQVQGIAKVNSINSSWYICSKHFVDGKPTVINPNPLIAGSHPPVLLKTSAFSWRWKVSCVHFVYMMGEVLLT